MNSGLRSGRIEDIPLTQTSLIYFLSVVLNLKVPLKRIHY